VSSGEAEGAVEVGGGSLPPRGHTICPYGVGDMGISWYGRYGHIIYGPYDMAHMVWAMQGRQLRGCGLLAASGCQSCRHSGHAGILEPLMKGMKPRLTPPPTLLPAGTS